MSDKKDLDALSAVLGVSQEDLGKYESEQFEDYIKAINDLKLKISLYVDSLPEEEQDNSILSALVTSIASLLRGLDKKTMTAIFENVIDNLDEVNEKMVELEKFSEGGGN